MITQRLLLFASLAALALHGCKRISAPAPERIALDSTLVVPESVLNVPVYFPVQELEDLANNKLGSKVIEADIAISEKEDSIFLSISRFQPITITYDGDRGLTYTIPVQLEGYLKSKVIGIKIQNKEAIRAKIVITMFSDLYLDDDWNLAPQTELKSIKWIEEPKIKVAGIKFNLKPPIEKALENNKQKIVEKLDESAKNIIKIRPSIEKLWGDIQKPIRINRKVVPVWLKGDATDIDGRLYAQSKDTLMIKATIKARLHTVLDSASAVTKPTSLPRLKRKDVGEPGLTAYALATVPFNVINETISLVTDTMEFKFGSHKVGIKSSEVYGTSQGIAIRVTLKGDLVADVYMRGTLGFDSLERKLVIENFGFDVNSESSLLNAANWFAHDEVIDRLKPYLSIPLGNLFEAIPTLINKGIEKGKLGKKINIHFTEFDVNIYQYLITTDNIQVIVSAKGRADVELQKGLFDKKKKPI
ncbi:DUF4403 family protein [Oscillatoria amoena NRMC-F 0135]|nr:DUF4403 family protein [Oscillatoria amoena NRMC-F 0135]